MTEATTWTGPNEKDALASALANVPSSTDKARNAVGEVLLAAEAAAEVEVEAAASMDGAMFAIVRVSQNRAMG